MGLTRAERRRQERQKSNVVTYQLTAEQLSTIRRESMEEATKTAFLLMLGIPIIVLKDNFGQLIRKTVSGKNREQRFLDACVERYRQFEEGYFTLDDVRIVLKEECDVESISWE